MSWKTIYIFGKKGFKSEVSRKVRNSDLNHMKGNNDGELQIGDQALYWLDCSHTLREFKEVITAKIIWKYRIRFYTSLEEFVNSKHEKTESNFSHKEKLMIRKMQYIANSNHNKPPKSQLLNLEL